MGRIPNPLWLAYQQISILGIHASFSCDSLLQFPICKFAKKSFVQSCSNNSMMSHPWYQNWVILGGGAILRIMFALACLIGGCYI